MKRWIHAAVTANKGNNYYNNLLDNASEPILSSLETYNYWISKEKCGNANTLDEAEDYVLSRTVRNKRSSYYNNPEKYSERISELFNWARDNDLTTADLITLSNRAVARTRRELHREFPNIRPR